MCPAILNSLLSTQLMVLTRVDYGMALDTNSLKFVYALFYASLHFCHSREKLN